MAFIARGRTKGFLSVYGEPLLLRIIKFMTEGLTGRLQMNVRSPEGSLDIYLELLNGFPIICVAIQASRPIVGIDCLDILTRIKCVNCLIEVLELGLHEINVDIDYVKSYYGLNAIISKEQANSFIERAKRLIEQLKPKQIPRKVVQKTAMRPALRPAPKPVQELPKPAPRAEKKPTIQPKPPSKHEEVKEEIERRERERERVEKGKEEVKKLEVKVERAKEEKESVAGVAVIGSIDDVSRELLNPLLLVRLLTSMEFISGFTGSASEFFKRICEISKSIPEAVYIARIRVGPKVYRVAAVNGKLVAAVVEEGGREVYGRDALETLLKEKTVIASIARVPVDMLPDKMRGKIVVEEHSTKQQNRNNQEFQGVHELTHHKEEVNE